MSFIPFPLIATHSPASCIVFFAPHMDLMMSSLVEQLHESLSSIPPLHGLLLRNFALMNTFKFSPLKSGEEKPNDVVRAVSVCVCVLHLLKIENLSFSFCVFFRSLRSVAYSNPNMGWTREITNSNFAVKFVGVATAAAAAAADDDVDDCNSCCQPIVWFLCVFFSANCDA